MKEHFSSYGDLTTVDLEDVEALDDGNSSDASRNCSARVTFTTRRSAERAFVNGKCWQGHNLHFMWLTSSNSGNELSGQEGSPSASKGSSDADLQPAGKACNSSLETALSGNGEPEVSERESSMEHKEPDGNFQASLTVSCEEQSPKGNIC